MSLVASWDSFSTYHRMGRDTHQDRAHWRDCHTFRNIVCDGDCPCTSSDGGLEMRQRYYFYHEMDGSFETYDDDNTLPSASACPYLPGPHVHVMDVPTQQPVRQRSVSLGSIRYDNFVTMDPAAKFSAPRAAPPPPAIPDFLGPRYRLPTAPHAPSLKHQRSISPTSTSRWSPRKLFTRMQSPSSVRSDAVSASEARGPGSSPVSTAPSSRPMSPESLRKFLSDEPAESPCAESVAEPADRLALTIPEDAAEDAEDEDEDDDFAVASAVSEFGPKTILSPPPPLGRPNSSPHTKRCRTEHGPAVTLKPTKQAQPDAPRARLPASCTISQQQQQPTPQEQGTHVSISRFSVSSDESISVHSNSDDDEREACPTCDTSAHADEIPSFYYSDDDDDDDDDDNDDEDADSCPSPYINFSHKRAGLHMDRAAMEQTLAAAFEGYRLPSPSGDAGATGSRGRGSKLAPPVSHQIGEASVASSPPLLALPAMDDFAGEFKSAGLF